MLDTNNRTRCINHCFSLPLTMSTILGSYMPVFCNLYHNSSLLDKTEVRTVRTLYTKNCSLVTPLPSRDSQHQHCISNIPPSPTDWGWAKSWEDDSQESWPKPHQRSNITCWWKAKNGFFFLCAHVTFCFYFIKLPYLNLQGFYFYLISSPILLRRGVIEDLGGDLLSSQGELISSQLQTPEAFQSSNKSL